MFGYIGINKAELKFREFDVYHSYYCGLCRCLKKRHGLRGQMTLSYDMTFLVMLLTGLYEPENTVCSCRCAAHPFHKHAVRINSFTEYAADMNVIFSYYKCMDDWADEHKLGRLAYGKLLNPECRKLEKTYGEKIQRVDSLLKELSCGEKQRENLDLMAGRFGQIMAEIFAWRSDEWEAGLRKIGFYLGKFIYLADAYEDLEEDRKKGNYNPFSAMAENENFEEYVKNILTMMMAECSRGFEQLPVLQDVEILRNILYSGVWVRYEAAHRKRQEKGGEQI